MVWRYEHHGEPLITRLQFYRRIFFHTLTAIAIIVFSLIIGILGYHFIEGLPWLDALLNASMILGGMGPVNPLHTAAGKIFASIYALYSGVIFLLTFAVIIAPVAHRLVHRFHLETEEDVVKEEEEKPEDAPGKI